MMRYTFILDGEYVVDADSLADALDKVLSKVTRYKSARDELLARLKIKSIGSVDGENNG